MDEAILDVARSIQPYLPSLVGEHAEELDGKLAFLLRQAHAGADVEANAGADVEKDLLAVLESSTETRGLLFLVFIPWSPWALVAALGVAALALLVWVPARAATFAALVEAAFDLYRQDLYTQLRWPLPASPHDERRQGRPVTTYLLRGSDATTPLFTPLQAAEPPPLPWPAAEGVSRPESAQQGDRDQPS
jgi:hypothetical protein